MIASDSPCLNKRGEPVRRSCVVLLARSVACRPPALGLSLVSPLSALPPVPTAACVCLPPSCPPASAPSKCASGDGPAGQ
eukprot:2170815-Alexandrium_andersonii.AAC.1